MGRTRPKKLTSKASIPIVREDQIDAIDEDVQSALQQVETGVEKAEESVRIFFFFASLPSHICHVIYMMLFAKIFRVDQSIAFLPFRAIS